MLRSETINSGNLRFNCMRAANASFAVETSYPAETNRSSRLSRMLDSSSTTRIGYFEGVAIVPLSSRGQSFSPRQINISFGQAGVWSKLDSPILDTSRVRWWRRSGEAASPRFFLQLLKAKGVPSERPAPPRFVVNYLSG